MRERGGKERATPTFLMKIAIPAYSNEVTINRTKPVNYAHVNHAHTDAREQMILCSLEERASLFSHAHFITSSQREEHVSLSSLIRPSTSAAFVPLIKKFMCNSQECCICRNLVLTKLLKQLLVSFLQL